MNPIAVVGSVGPTTLTEMLLTRGGGVDGSIVGVMAVAVVGFTVLLAFTFLLTQRTARERARRLELIAEALRRPDLDPEARSECLRALRPSDSGTKWLFTTGWLGLGASVCWFCAQPRGDEFTLAVMASVMSFAVLTLPLAWREATRARTPA